ncbi:MAG TPA: glycerophosphodiester phosphodiesterase family protein [Actinomycetota bacterium]|nr:glycerophosphodiester phosphodiesterase family protein [Actinomycetota bacterium]
MGDRRFPADAFPAIVAHRGASSTRPENTIAAFEEAMRLGARVIELDVRLSRDGVAVVVHDPTVERTTDGTGAVHELTAAELRALDAGTSDHPASVPTLADVLDLLSGQAAAALEIKNLPGEPAYEPDGESIVEAAHAELDRVGFDGPVLVISFNPSSISASKALDPTVPTGLLAADPLPIRDALSLAAAGAHDMVLPGTRTLLPAGQGFVATAHEAGLRVGTWTVDEPDLVRRLLDWGVDAIASNDPEAALGVLAGR